jgi:CheY-like chemotaxis protein
MNDDRKIALLVEDEPLIALDGCEIMEDLGFEVLEARTKFEALAILGVESRITLLFTDIDLADGSSGVDLAREFARLHPVSRLSLHLAASALPLSPLALVSCSSLIRITRWQQQSCPAQA